MSTHYQSFGSRWRSEKNKSKSKLIILRLFIPVAFYVTRIIIDKVEHNLFVQYYLYIILRPNAASSGWQEWTIHYSVLNGNLYIRIFICTFIYKCICMYTCISEMLVGFLTFEDGTDRTYHYSLRSSPDDGSSQI